MARQAIDILRALVAVGILTGLPEGRRAAKPGNRRQHGVFLLGVAGQHRPHHLGQAVALYAGKHAENARLQLLLIGVGGLQGMQLRPALLAGKELRNRPGVFPHGAQVLHVQLREHQRPVIRPEFLTV